MGARVVLNLSPFVESDILSFNNLDNLGRSLIQVKKILDDLTLTFSLIIPKELMQSFYVNPFLKIFIEAVLENTQSNIFFQNTIKSAECVEADVASQFVDINDIHFIPTNIINIFIKKKNPLLYDNLARQVVKSNCPTCAGTQLCGDRKDINSTNLALANIVHDVALLNDNNYSILKSKNPNWDLEDIRKIALFEALKQGVDIRLLYFANEIEISQSCLSEIRRVSSDDMVEIAFSMFRSLAYVSSRKPDRCNFSIDYHPETVIAKHKGFDIERCDVIEPHKHGNTASGTKRLLRLLKDNKVKFAGYVTDHDFSEDLIKSRIRSETE